jgi:hypothetical protein
VLLGTVIATERQIFPFCGAYECCADHKGSRWKMPVALSFYKVVPSNAAARSLIGALGFSRAATWISCSCSPSCTCRLPASGTPFADGDEFSLEEGSALL